MATRCSAPQVLIATPFLSGGRRFGYASVVRSLRHELAAIVREPDRSALLLDFDGTLAPIVTDPAAATLPPETTQVLGALQSRIARVAIVSGRPVHFLREALGPIPITLVGLYGTERFIDGVPTIDDRVEVYRPAIERAAQAAEHALTGLLIERKGVSFTIHWRASPAREQEALRQGRMVAERFGLTTEVGRMALEVRPPTKIDKGQAVLPLVGTYKHVLFAGDDRADIPAFTVLRNHAIRTATHVILVAVASDESPPELTSLADFTVDGPHGLLSVLQLLLTALQQPAI